MCEPEGLSGLRSACCYSYVEQGAVGDAFDMSCALNCQNLRRDPEVEKVDSDAIL